MLIILVVNCLQFFIFTRFFAVNICSLFPLFLLWIAYNFLSLQGSLQFHRLNNVSRTSCELLTIFYLYKVLCSFKHCSCLTKSVVNCLQFFIFTRFFAVNPAEIANHLSCELLTIFYLYKVLCSKPYNKRRAWCVVNCLQFFIFTRFFAVNCKNVSWHWQLWIAYNFLSLQGSLQSYLTTFHWVQSCELLTIFYLYKVLCS